MVHSDGNPLWVAPMKTTPELLTLGEMLRLLKTVDAELQAPKANGYTEGEATAGQVLTISDDGECR
jgi:hypothetical protein